MPQPVVTGRLPFDPAPPTGVSIGHEDGPFTAAHPRGVPQLSYFYLAAIGGRNFGLEISSADDVVFADPRTWFVPNCPACRGCLVVPLP